jgi:hypothetical protein
LVGEMGCLHSAILYPMVGAVPVSADLSASP